MKKKIKDQFYIIRASIKNIEGSRAKTDIRKNTMLLQVWNRTFDFLMEHAETNYELNQARSYYGRLSSQMTKQLSWEQMKQLTNEIMEGTL